MAKFRKKPVVIEATQFFKDGDHSEVRSTRAETPSSLDPTGFYIPTLEGRMAVTPSDWIITGVKGEHYPCKPDVFEQSYEPADGASETERLRDFVAGVGGLTPEELCAEAQGLINAARIALTKSEESADA